MRFLVPDRSESSKDPAARVEMAPGSVSGEGSGSGWRPNQIKQPRAQAQLGQLGAHAPVAAEAAATKPRLERTETNRTESNRAREVELREEQLGAPNSSTNPSVGESRRVVVAGAGDLRPGSGESFLIGGFLCPPSPFYFLFFFPFEKSACVYLHAITRAHAHERRTNE